MSSPRRPRFVAPVLAIDIGATKTLVAAVEGAGRDGFHPIRPPVRLDTPRDPGALLDAIVLAAAAAAPQAWTPAAIGIGAPGPLDPVTGMIEWSPNLGWRQVPLARLIGERFGGVPTFMEGDGNAAALGEARLGCGLGSETFAFFTLGTGLGVGIVVNGRVVSGAHHSAGELGHLAVGDRVGPMCHCRRRNCVEAWCGGAGLARRAAEMWPSARLPSGEPAPRDAASVFQLAKRGDAVANELVRAARHALAVAVAAVLATIDPAVIAIGGTIGLSQRAFASAAAHEGRGLAIRTAGSQVQIRPPMLGQASVLAGAAVLAAVAVGVDA